MVPVLTGHEVELGWKLSRVHNSPALLIAQPYSPLIPYWQSSTNCINLSSFSASSAGHFTTHLHPNSFYRLYISILYLSLINVTPVVIDALSVLKGERSSCSFSLLMHFHVRTWVIRKVCPPCSRLSIEVHGKVESPPEQSHTNLNYYYF